MFKTKGNETAAEDQSRAQAITLMAEDLTAIYRGFVAPPALQPGDLVVTAPYLRQSGSPFCACELAVVLETCPSLRKMMGNPNLPDAAGVFVAFEQANESIATAWVSAWQYMKAPADLVSTRALHA